MRSRIAIAVLAASASVALLAGCSSSSDYVYVAPATAHQVGEDLWQVELTEAAAARTGIEVSPVVEETVAGAQRLIIPYSAVIYHYDGSTWTYTNPDDLTYLRAAIEVEAIEGDRAVLTSGPRPGTDVVSVGAAELYGVEFGIGK